MSALLSLEIQPTVKTSMNLPTDYAVCLLRREFYYSLANQNSSDGANVTGRYDSICCIAEVQGLGLEGKLYLQSLGDK
jgi:hypothetical protein